MAADRWHAWRRLGAAPRVKCGPAWAWRARLEPANVAAATGVFGPWLRACRCRTVGDSEYSEYMLCAIHKCRRRESRRPPGGSIAALPPPLITSQRLRAAAPQRSSSSRACWATAWSQPRAARRATARAWRRAAQTGHAGALRPQRRCSSCSRRTGRHRCTARPPGSTRSSASGSCSSCSGSPSCGAASRRPRRRPSATARPRA